MYMYIEAIFLKESHSFIHENELQQYNRVNEMRIIVI